MRLYLTTSSCNSICVAAVFGGAVLTTVCLRFCQFSVAGTETTVTINAVQARYRDKGLLA